MDSPNNPEYELKLARNLVQVSNVLATQLYPETLLMPYSEQGHIGTWRMHNAEFSKPKLHVRGYDISDDLYDLGQRTNDILVDMSVCPEEYDKDFGLQPPSYNWDARPSTPLLEGLKFSVSSPVVIPDNSPEAIKNLRGYGLLNLDMLVWYDSEDEMVDITKKENSLLYLILTEPLANLYVAQWLLQGLTRPKDIHQVQLNLFGNIL